uniref:Inositol hexakisphosphate and diphosphoinositol-pentakisphosphate kinase n=1 Tax=Romanomermis culicivorax TaxID=13658 RepID=A0A915HEC3_ROMCU
MNAKYNYPGSCTRGQRKQLERKHSTKQLVAKEKEDTENKKGNLEEYDDHIVVNGVTFNKPFVEKPVSAEDHNIRIYYPSTAGGGSQQLFRKTNNRSSVYSPESTVRKEGSYVYEDFMPTDGTDVKVYAVGPDYAHAEARKSPALDGKVERDADGKEVRYPVILSHKEKLIARKIVWSFRQMVCGFDLLRAGGKSFVCDVNGFSFVKTSSKYYEDSARILGNMILRRTGSPFITTFQLGLYVKRHDPPLVPTTYGTMMELRCVLAIFFRFWELFRKYNGYQTGELKLKKPQQLQEVLDSARYLLIELNSGTPEKQAEIHENKAKLEQLKTIRYQPTGKPKKSSDTEPESNREPSLILIVKWGGELTDAGKMQAEELGKAFRCLYPGGGHYGADSRGLGFLRLHSTYRHDLKMYASEEGRVQMTAAAFAKGLLALEGELPPILVQMVKSAHTDGLLDDDKDARHYQSAVKKFLHEYFQQDVDLTNEDVTRLNPIGDKSIANALQFVGNPRKMCERVFQLVEKFCHIISCLKRDNMSQKKHLYCGETWDLAERRWSKLVKDFKHVKKGGEFVYDISKIPDIYDCIKYDLEHNFRVFNIDDMEELYICSKYMADFVIPQ